MKEISAAMVKAQKEFGPALKTHTNPAFRSKYADLSACVEAVIDALNNNEIFLMQPTHECTDGVIVETVFIHSSGEQISSGKLHVPATKHDAQGYGSALTYARRYSLMAACGIAPEDDDGNYASKPKPAQARPVAKQEPVNQDTPKQSVLTKIEGKDSSWQLKVTSEPGLDHGEWAKLVIDATQIQLGLVKTEAEVMDVFKTNRNIYDEVKRGSPSLYDSLMEHFKSARAKHKEAA